MTSFINISKVPAVWAGPLQQLNPP